MLPVWPITELMLTIRPEPRSRMWSSTALVMWNAPDRLIGRPACKSSTVIRRIVLSTVTPALLIRWSTRPYPSSTSPTTRSQSSGTPTLPWCTDTEAPSAPSLPASSSAACRLLLYPAATGTPERASAVLIAAPMPRAPPVTMATLRSLMWVLPLGRAAASLAEGHPDVIAGRAGRGAEPVGLRGGGPLGGDDSRVDGEHRVPADRAGAEAGREHPGRTGDHRVPHGVVQRDGDAGRRDVAHLGDVEVELVLGEAGRPGQLDDHGPVRLVRHDQLDAVQQRAPGVVGVALVAQLADHLVQVATDQGLDLGTV